MNKWGGGSMGGREGGACGNMKGGEGIYYGGERGGAGCGVEQCAAPQQSKPLSPGPVPAAAADTGESLLNSPQLVSNASYSSTGQKLLFYTNILSLIHLHLLLQVLQGSHYIHALPQVVSSTLF